MLFVAPILVIWPAMRKPTYSVAAIWGVLSAEAAVVLLGLAPGESLREVLRLSVHTLLHRMAGAASGLFCAYVVRRWSHAEAWGHTMTIAIPLLDRSQRDSVNY